jgi:bifunctional non-homologous end joining protein LigD
MARRDPVGIRLITRGGNDWTQRYPLVAEAVNHLKVRSFQLLRHWRNEQQAFLFAFDLLELNGADLRREPIEVRKATLASTLRTGGRVAIIHRPLTFFAKNEIQR